MDANDGLDSDMEFEDMDEDDAQEVDDNEGGRSDGERDEEMGIWNSRPENDDDTDDDNDCNTDTPMRPIDTSQSMDSVLVQPRPRFIRLPTAFEAPNSPATSYLTRSSSATLFSPAPTTSSLPKPHFTSHQAKATKIQLKHELRTATTRLRFTEANLMAANAHCTVMAMENAELREQLALANAKKGRKGRGPKQALGVFLTPPERKEARRLEREKREADAVVAAEEQRQKEAAVQARWRQRLHNAIHQVFDKPLSSYQNVKKDELQDLAAALALDEIGTKGVIFARIEDHVKSHPELQQNDRFKALFGASRRGGARRQP